MTVLFRLLAACLCLLTAISCRKPPEPVNPAEFETPAAVAVLHQVLKDAGDAAAAAKVGVIMLGPRLEDVTPEFRGKFADTGHAWHAGKDMTQVWIGPVARIIEKESKLQPIQLQILSVEKTGDGVEEIVAGWAYEDRMLRRRYRATKNGDEWTIQPLEVIDQKPAAGAEAEAKK